MKMSVATVLSMELGIISVSDEEVLRLKKISRNFISKLKKMGFDAYVGGSLAKGTLIRKGRQDVDIFVVFDYSEDMLGFEGVLKKMKLDGKLSRIHGSRDYFHVDYGDVVLEIIPVVRCDDLELAENVTDMSLSHVDFVRGEIERNPCLADEIRLAKAFCQANRFYGAEGYVRGFSGYSLEVLVIYFGSFVKFLRGVSKKRVVDFSKHFRNDREVLREINSSKLQGPLVVVDPTYRYRNICAGLGERTFERFLKVSREFLKAPSLEFFERRGVDVEALGELAKKKKARFLEVVLRTDRQSGDIAGTKMKKVFDFFVRELLRNGQVVLMRDFDYDGFSGGAVGFLAVKEALEVEVRGPSVGLEEASRKFCEARRGCYRKGKFWFWRRGVSIEGVLEGNGGGD
jgi:tRNA nucleotidyltransferase (CCA-adding enzyme)